MSGLLEGLRVVAMEHMEAMPAASVWLADWGAEVIKVEPLRGEMWRRGRRVAHNWSFQLLNRNKESLALDLKNETGREILYKLVETADAFMTNYQLDALNNLKADYDSLKEVNPGLVYALVSGYGTEGPDKDLRGYDYTAAWARAGFQYILGEPDSPPVQQRGGVMDRTTAPHVVAGVCAALLRKAKTGEGQLVEVSIYRSAVWTLALDIEACLAGMPPERRSRTHSANPLVNAYRTGDGRWIQLAMRLGDFTWPGVFKAIGRQDLEADPRFATNEARTEHTEDLIRILDEVFATKTLEEWDGILRENNFIYAPIQSPNEVLTDPQAVANDFFGEIHHPEGDIRVVNTPVRFVQNPASIRKPAPENGEDNDRIMRELGYSDEAIMELRAGGIIY